MKKFTCRHCGEHIKLDNAGAHLQMCAPDIHRAIAEEFNQKEKAAKQRSSEGLMVPAFLV